MKKQSPPNLTRQNLTRCEYLSRIATIKIFTPDECTDIINTSLNKWDEQESMILQSTNFVEDLDYRNATMFVPHEPPVEVLKKIEKSIMSFNFSEGGYGFEIVGMAEPPCMLRYLASDIHPKGKPGKYDWHMDIGSKPVSSIRKISFSIFLNAGEYEGGELEFHTGRTTEPDQAQNSSNFIGSAFVFPSYLMHRVLEVTKGIRYTLVGWVHGNSFV